MPMPDWLILCTWRALLGEIYPAIRAIALSLSDQNILTLRCYLDREPLEADFENMEVIATNITAAIGLDKIADIEIECHFATAPFKNLDSLDGFIYCRREYI